MKPEIRCNDNLVELRKIPSESVDLVYIDPPFFTQRHQGDYDDRWAGMNEYLSYMQPRLQEIHRVLKPSGSLYLHADHHASHYLKVMADSMFGTKNFINDITWQRYSGRKNFVKRRYMNQSESILFYAKGKGYTFNASYAPVSSNYTSKERVLLDKDGNRYYLSRGGNYMKTGERKRIYVDDVKGSPLTNLWIDPSLMLGPSAKEKTGYSTQKPESLLHRIISTSSNKGDTVLDAFAGSGTTCTVAKKLGRKSICIDVNPKACKIMEERLK